MQTHLRENMWFTSFGRDCLPQLACIFVTVDVLLAFKPHYSSQAFQSLYYEIYAYKGYIWASIHLMVQVNLCQKNLFLQQLTHNMSKDSSLNYEFSNWKLQAQNMYTNWFFVFVFTFRKNYVLNMFWACSFDQWMTESMFFTLGQNRNWKNIWP